MTQTAHRTTARKILLSRIFSDLQTAQACLNMFRVKICATVDIDMSSLVLMLDELGIEVANDKPDLVLIITANYLSPRLAVEIRYAEKIKVPALVCSPFGQEIKVGPLLLPGMHCWNCVRARLALHNPTYMYWRKVKPLNASTETPPLGYTSTSVTAAFSSIVADIAHIAVHKGHELLEQHIISMGFKSGYVTRHTLSPLSLCSACRRSRSMQEQTRIEQVLDPRRTIDYTAALERARDRLAPLISPMTGIVSRIDTIPTPYANDRYCIKYAAYRLPVDYRSLDDVLANQFRSSSALGRSQLEAEVKAGYEAVEHFNIAYHGGEEGLFARAGELSGRIVPVTTLLGFSDEQYLHRVHINEHATTPAELIPYPWRPAEPIHWCRARSIFHNDDVWVPMGYCYSGFSRDEKPIVFADSNGSAAGPDMQFCFAKGLLEVCERDAVSIWHYNMLAKRLVDWSSWKNEYMHHLADVHQGLGRKIWVLDIRSDVPLFAFVALSLDEQTGQVIQGFGAHFDAERALCKALEECCQMLPNVIHPLERHSPHSISGATIAGRSDGQIAIDSTSVVPMDVQMHHAPNHQMKPLTYEEAQRLSYSLEEVLAYLQTKSLDVLVKDMSRPETGICTLKVIVPGLRSWYRRLGPGRLYEVPVIQNERLFPNKEQDMNKQAILF